MPAASMLAAPASRTVLGEMLQARVGHPSPAVPLNAARLIRDALIIMALLLVTKAGTAGAVIFFVILGVMIFISPQAAFKSLAICYLGLMLNTAFVPKSLVWTPGRLIIPFLALVRYTADLAALRYSLLNKPSYAFLLLFSATMAVGSIVSGWCTHIALLKLFNFVAVITAILGGTAVLRLRRIDIGQWFVSLILAGTLFGIASVVLGVGNNSRPMAIGSDTIIMAQGFNGAFVHPNLHAMYASLFVIFLALVWIFSRYRRTWLTLPMIACWFVFMAMSGSRTSFIASFIGIAVLVAFAGPARNHLGWRIRPKISRWTLLLLLGLGATSVMIWDVSTGGSISESIVQFINKGGSRDEAGAALDTEKILYSRKGLIEYSWKNFQENSLFGIGFGVAKTEEFLRTATLFTAPAEKGFLPTAILEEGGILGTITFVLFLTVFMWELLRERNIAGFVIFFVYLATNLGEVSIFAPGGGGSFGWMTVSAAMILGDHCFTPPVPWMLRAPSPTAAASAGT